MLSRCPRACPRGLTILGTLPKPRELKCLSTLSQSPSPDKAVGFWLLGCSGLVAGMVCIGGLTRLTKSGLSMTEWNLTGRKPPMNHDEWLVEFERYKTFPEWQQRQSMTLDEFKVTRLGCLSRSLQAAHAFTSKLPSGLPLLACLSLLPIPVSSSSRGSTGTACWAGSWAWRSGSRWRTSPREEGFRRACEAAWSLSSGSGAPRA